MLALSAILVSLIFANLVDTEPSLFNNTEHTNQIIPLTPAVTIPVDDNAYYVDFDATRLITGRAQSDPYCLASSRHFCYYPSRSQCLRSRQPRTSGISPHRTRPRCFRAGTVAPWVAVADSEILSVHLFSASADNPFPPDNTWCAYSESLQQNSACSVFKYPMACYLIGANEAFKTASNSSEVSRVAYFLSGEKAMAYLRNGMAAYSGFNYHARTFAVSTRCFVHSAAVVVDARLDRRYADDCKE